MKYTKEDYNFIKSWLDKCIKIQKDDIIFFITSDNIVRQLKYNSLLKNKKNISIDLTKITFENNVILQQNLEPKYFWLFNSILFNNFSNISYALALKHINNILCDILKLNGYETDYSEWFYGANLDYIFNSNKHRFWKDKTYTIL